LRDKVSLDDSNTADSTHSHEAYEQQTCKGKCNYGKISQNVHKVTENGRKAGAAGSSTQDDEGKDGRSMGTTHDDHGEMRNTQGIWRPRNTQQVSMKPFKNGMWRRQVGGAR
jgi:hypothetical protein